MTSPKLDPLATRQASLRQLLSLHLPLPPDNFPLVWEPGDGMELRSIEDIEARMAVLNVVMARVFGMPSSLAMEWLLAGHLVDSLTKPEWQFVATNEGNRDIFALHLEALFALAWVLGITMDLDPIQPAPDGLTARLPDLLGGESYPQWRSRTLTAQRAPWEVAAVLDLYYCLDWAYLEAERIGLPLPGPITSNAIGQRRWALEWVVIFTGPYHDPPRGWEEVDLST